MVNPGTPTASAFTAPARLKLLKLAFRGLRACRAINDDLSMEGVLGAARRRTGLADFGPGDFRTPLRLLLDAYRAEPRLDALGRFMVRKGIVQSLCNRLQMEAAWKGHPEILAIPIRRPLFVVGLPRTGTTFFHRLRAADPAAWAPRMWELQRPAPAARGWLRRDDPRRSVARREAASIRCLHPALRAIHDPHADAPEECHYLFSNAFANPLYAASARVPEYLEWYDAQPMTQQYRYYRQQLQLLLWQRPGDEAVLKCPAHLGHLPALLQEFPDARIVWMHRDPAQAVASLVSLLATFSLLMNDGVDVGHLGALWLDILAKCMRRALDVRATADTGQFCDVQYAEFVRDPLGVMRRVYRHFGDELGADAEARMAGWLAHQGRPVRARHVYTLSQCGLSPAQVAEQFADYAPHADRPRADRNSCTATP